MNKGIVVAFSMSILLLNGCANQANPEDDDLATEYTQESTATDTAAAIDSSAERTPEQIIAAEKKRIDAVKNQEFTPVETVAINQEQQSELNGLSVHLQSADIYDGSDELLQPDHGRFIVVSVKLINTSSTSLDIENSAFELKAVDSGEERAISQSLSTTHYKSFPPQITLKAGESIVTDLAYDVPTSTSYKFTYHELFRSAKLRWDFQFQTDQPKS